MTPGIFWVGQQTQSNHLARADRNLAWVHIAFLCTVVLVPFSTSPAEFIHYRIALPVFGLKILLGAGATPPASILSATICRRRFILAVVRLGFINPGSSIAALVLAQRNDAIAPRLCRGWFSNRMREKEKPA